jgi:hypothetical protein
LRILTRLRSSEARRFRIRLRARCRFELLRGGEASGVSVGARARHCIELGDGLRLRCLGIGLRARDRVALLRDLLAIGIGLLLVRVRYGA